jgi:mannose-6-phosphate isomerase
VKNEAIFQYKPVQRIPKPWGYELIFAKTGRYIGKILHIDKGESLSLQYHEMKEESLYVLHGKVALTVEFDGDRRVIPLAEGQAFHVPPRLIHRMEAVEDTDIAEVSTTELDDVIRLEDRYGRVEKRSST